MPESSFQYSFPASLGLSVITVSYNTREILIDCLESVRSQTAGLRYEILVVDNNSLDGSAKAVKDRFTDIRVFENPENRGFSAACNQGIRDSKGRYIVLLNSDTLLVEDCFSKIVRYLDGHPEFHLLSPQILDGENRPCPMRLWEDSPRDAMWKILGVYNPTEESKKMGTIEPREVEAIGGSCFVIRRELFEETGLLDEGHFLYNEEDDLCRRARKNGLKICYYPEASIRHFHGQSTRRPEHREKVILETYKSNLYFYSKYYSRSWNLVLRALYRMVFILGIMRSLVKPLAGRPPSGADDSIFLKLKMLFMRAPGAAGS
ncbi:MAG: glycosyltransferase family 2 protein [Nitrospinaceae bacterium]